MSDTGFVDGRLFKFFSDITYAELMIKGAVRFPHARVLP